MELSSSFSDPTRFDDGLDLCFLVKTKFICQIWNIFTSIWSSYLILFHHKLILHSQFTSANIVPTHNLKYQKDTAEYFSCHCEKYFSQAKCQKICEFRVSWCWRPGLWNQTVLVCYRSLSGAVEWPGPSCRHYWALSWISCSCSTLGTGLFVPERDVCPSVCPVPVSVSSTHDAELRYCEVKLTLCCLDTSHIFMMFHCCQRNVFIYGITISKYNFQSGQPIILQHWYEILAREPSKAWETRNWFN